MSRDKSKDVNSGCTLISKTENETLFRILGPNCHTLSSGVVQLFLADSSSEQWNKHFCGIACFVKDSNQRSYFIRIFDIKREQMVWQQELYQQFRYKAPRDFLHTFEADRCQAALNFASEDEAMTFKNIVDQKLTERHQRRMNRKSKMAPKATVGNAMTPQTVEDSAALVKPTGTVWSKTTRERHVNHVGLDPSKGFEIDKLDPDMKQLVLSIGIKPDDNIDKETMEYIYDFVDKRGGLDAVKKEMAVTHPPPPITRSDRKRQIAPKAAVGGNTRVPSTVEESVAPAEATGTGWSKTVTERHVNHVGFDPNKDFEMDKLDPDMKRLFQSVGIKPGDNIDKDTMEFIYDFVDKRGGLEAVKKEMAVTPPPPPITRAAAPPVQGRQAKTAPATPPPPAPKRRVDAPPPPQPPAHSSRGAPPPPLPFKGGPPAPPPVVGGPPSPPPCCGPQPPPPPTSSVPDELAGLQGMQLKKVSTDGRPPNARGELLGAVKGGSDTLTLMDRLDPDMKRLSQSDGIKTHDNIYKNILAFICDLVEKMGGIDAVKREMAVNRPPPPITRTGDDDESEDEDDFDDFIYGASSSC